MSVKITTTTSVSVGDNQVVADSKTISVGAYDVINVTIAADGEPVVVNVQPSAAPQIRFLVIKSSVLDPLLTYQVLEEAPANPPVDLPDNTPGVFPLDSIQSFYGAGVGSFLGAAPNVFVFRNGTDTSADVQMLVGREPIVAE